MPKFDVAAYKKQLETSDSCDTCKKVPAPKLEKDTRYIFISYSHKDYKKVYADLADLYESGIPFWYDEGLPAGKNWDDVVREKMTDPRCVGIIFFLSENLFLSRSIQTEIKIAIGEDGNSNLPQIKREYFSVNLTNMSPSEILRKISQMKEFPDIEDGMAALLSWVDTLAKAFPDKATFLPFDNGGHKDKLIEQIDVNFGIKPNYNPYAFGDAMFRSGNGVIAFANGAVYEGAFADNLFEGQGKLTYSNGAVYEGEWVKGMRCGQGVFTRLDGIVYDGAWADDSAHGHGIFTFPDGAVYDGEWSEGKHHGHGIFTYPDGSVYDGEWVAGEQCGQCTFTRGSDGHKYVGGWGENGSAGFGTYIYPDGASRSGTWDGALLIEGKGVLRYDDGSEYNGQIRNNLRHGTGTLTLPDGTKQTGRFENDHYLGEN